MAIAGLVMLLAGLLAGITALWIAGVVAVSISFVLLLAGYAARVPGQEDRHGAA